MLLKDTNINITMRKESETYWLESLVNGKELWVEIEISLDCGVWEMGHMENNFDENIVENSSIAYADTKEEILQKAKDYAEAIFLRGPKRRVTMEEAFKAEMQMYIDKYGEEGRKMFWKKQHKLKRERAEAKKRLDGISVMTVSTNDAIEITADLGCTFADDTEDNQTKG